MKVPRFMKTSTHLSRQQSLARSNRQLKLADCGLTPLKLMASYKELTDIKPVQLADEAYVKPSMPSTPVPATPVAKTTAPIESKNFDPSKFSFKQEQFRPSLKPESRFKKNTKRLQSNQHPLSAKPVRDILRSANRSNLSDTYQEIDPISPLVAPSTPKLPFKILNSVGKIEEKAANYEFDFVDCSNKENFNFSDLPVSTTIRNESIPTLALAKQATPATGNRFSLSRLLQVSRSALKVMGRKSTGGGYGDSVGTTPASSASSSMHLTDEESADVFDAAKEVVNSPQAKNIYVECSPIEIKQERTLVQPQQQFPCFNASIYRSFEQSQEIEEKLNREYNNRSRSSKNQSREMPCMGLTAKVLKQHKKQNSTCSSNSSSGSYQYGATTSLATSSYLYAAPIIIHSASFQREEQSLKDSIVACKQQSQSVFLDTSNISNYDKLSRVMPFIVETSHSDKKISVKPISSMSSLTNMSSSARKHLTPAKMSSYKSAKFPSSCNKSTNVVKSGFVQLSVVKLEKKLHFESDV